MVELWKPISDPPVSNAFVSNTGKVKYLNNRGLFKTTFGSAQNAGYLQVKLGKRKYCTHILVAKHWCKKLSSKFKVVHHMDGNRSSNFAENLQWTTQVLNCSLRRGSSLYVKKKNRYVSKFIFDGVVIKSKQTFALPEEARQNSLVLRKKMYDMAYQKLILQENAPQPDSKPIVSPDHSRICYELEI